MLGVDPTTRCIDSLPAPAGCLDGAALRRSNSFPVAESETPSLVCCALVSSFPDDAPAAAYASGLISEDAAAVPRDGGS